MPDLCTWNPNTKSCIMRTIALLFLFSLFFISCEKNEPEFVVENINIPLISKVLIGGELYKEYTYNSLSLLEEEKSKFHYSRFTYNDHNQLILSDFYWDKSIASSNSRVVAEAMNRQEWVTPDNTPLSVSHSCEYDLNKQLVRRTCIRPQQGTSSIEELLFKDGRVIRSSSYREGEIYFYTDFTYDSDGNLILEKQYIVTPEGIAELQTITEYVYR